jgi:hypothetical protein
VKPEEAPSPWRVLGSRPVYENPWISVREDEVVRPDGNPGIYGVVHYKNTAVGVLPVEDGHVYLVGQYRYPLERYSWEIPEGGCPEDEDPLQAARRELKEETGLSAGEQQPDGTEVLGVRRVPLDEAIQMALDGRMRDALSQLALLGYALGWTGDVA